MYLTKSGNPCNLRGVAIQDSVGINSVFLRSVPSSLSPLPCHLFPVPCSLFPVPCSLITE
ncbi:MAG: hypothetical protein ACKPKM_15340, partial [Dolichospermum sp.]